MSLVVPHHIRPVKGVKRVARRDIVEERINWAESCWRVIRRERRTVFYELHPTKGWRRVGATEWKGVR